MIIIAAMAANRVIGRGDGMPWDVPAEYRHFLDTIRGQTVVIGRRSWEIFGPDLTSAHNVVCSRSLERIEGAVVAPDVDRAVAVARGFGRVVFCAGGARIYEQAIPLADTLLLSTIRGAFEGDVRFPEFDETAWEVVRREEHADYDLAEYRRRDTAAVRDGGGPA